LSQVLVENGKKEEALLFAHKTLDLSPDDLNVRELLASIYSGL
jgi:hypothetical protein